MLNTQAITNVKQLAKYFKSLGFMAHIKNPESIFVNYFYFDKFDEEIDSDSITFTGSVEEMLKQFETWYNDTNVWLANNKLLTVEYFNSPLDFDMVTEIISLGFKMAVVENEDTNFVSVRAHYCYLPEGDTFKFDGILEFDNIGDKFTTLFYLKNWIKQNKEFVPTMSTM